MKIVWSLAAVIALAVGLNFMAVDTASAWCGFRCGGGGVVVLPVAPVVVPAPVAVVPAPYAIPRGRCGRGCGAYVYGPYAYYAPPVTYAGGCYTGGCGAYWRRDCWYDMYGRRFCN